MSLDLYWTDVNSVLMLRVNGVITGPDGCVCSLRQEIFFDRANRPQDIRTCVGGYEFKSYKVEDGSSLQQPAAAAEELRLQSYCDRELRKIEHELHQEPWRPEYWYRGVSVRDMSKKTLLKLCKLLMAREVRDNSMVIGGR